MKKLLYHIINSTFFEELIQSYSSKNLLPENILKNKGIQDYIINNIIFLPYDENNFDTEAITFNYNAQIIVSGFPYSPAKEYENSKIYHILELSRKIIQISHEYIHSIKRYLGICTNELISSETLDENENQDEAGYLFEYCLFGWNKGKYKNLDKSFDQNRNNNLKNGYFDIPTVLKLLNPDLYNNNISSIRNILYNNSNDQKLQEFNNKKRNIDLTNFLSLMGYDSEVKIRELNKDKSKIFAGRDPSFGNAIKYQFKCGNIRKNI